MRKKLLKKIFKFIVSKIFLRKAILGIGVMLLLCMANYITFTAARSILSTFQGYQETKYINQEGVYIANLDLDSPIDMGIIDENGTQAVYDYLNSNFKYAFYTDGFMVSVPNNDDMEISSGYMNEQYYRLNHFELSQGTDLDFDYQLDGEIPVLMLMYGKEARNRKQEIDRQLYTLPTMPTTTEPTHKSIRFCFIKCKKIYFILENEVL